jgi:hypothetical protein
VSVTETGLRSIQFLGEGIESEINGLTKELLNVHSSEPGSADEQPRHSSRLRDARNLPNA